MRFQKIKFNKGKVRMEYEVENDKGDMDEFAFTCGDEPKPEFKEALQALDQDIIEMCELPVEYINRVTVTGVSFSYGGEGEVMGAVIVSQMRLNKSNVPLNLNSPHKASEPYGEDAQDEQLLDHDCVERLETLISEAEDYVKGIRAQKRFSFVEKTEGEAARAASA